MIVELTLPTGAVQVRYGQITITADQDRKIEVPGYVAKGLMALAGVIGPDLAGTAASLLQAAEDDSEANYLFWAYGQPLPSEGRIAAASALLTARGEPAVSLA
jgi:hypothetical protein